MKPKPEPTKEAKTTKPEVASTPKLVEAKKSTRGSISNAKETPTPKVVDAKDASTPKLVEAKKSTRGSTSEASPDKTETESAKPVKTKPEASTERSEETDTSAPLPMRPMNVKDKNRLQLFTREARTWCAGCPNFTIMQSVKDTLKKLILSKQYKHTDFAMVTDIGCNGKMFDYMNLSGIYALHGRAISTGVGIKLGNPNTKVLCFAGDGAVYSEGVSHFVHAFRTNPDMVLVLHDNQAFSLTTGQATPTSQKGYKNKLKPQGEENMPFNPILMALACGATFVARANARDAEQTSKILEKAIKHKGFSFIEVMQDCIIYNMDINNKDPRMYEIKDNKDEKKAYKYAHEFDYNQSKGKIPVGVIFQNKKVPDLTAKWSQLTKLKKGCWADKRK